MNELQKERRRKSRAKRALIITIIACLFAQFYGMHIITAMALNPRADISEAFNIGLIHMMEAPLEFKITWNAAYLLALLILLGVILLVLFPKEDREMKRHDNPDTVNGDARFMNMDDLQKYQLDYCDPIGTPRIDGYNNALFSKDIALDLNGFKVNTNANALIIGGSGAGKTRYFAAPNILQYNTNFVITDPSGELLADYGKALENAGYEVLVLNIVDVYRSNHYNPLHYIRTEKDVFILVNTLIRNTTPPDSHKGDPIWENGEKLLLEAIILYMWHMLKPKEQNFATVMKMLSLASIDENDATAQSPLDRLFDKLEGEDPENLAVAQYKKFKQGAGKTLKSFLISVETRLQAFDLADIRYLTQTDDFHFESFADSKKALFVIIPTADMTFNFIVSLLYSQLFMSMYDYVETRIEFGWCATTVKYPHVDKKDKKKKKQKPDPEIDQVIRVFQARTRTDSAKAEEEAKEFVEKVKHCPEPVYNEAKEYWEVRMDDGQVVGWRGSKEEAEAFRKSLLHLQAFRCPRHCPIHVRFILDEFANIGQIPEFDQKLSTIRKYWISCSIILQALSQLKEMYDKKWNTIVGNCDGKLFLGCDDSETLEWLQKKLGKRTTVVKNESYNEKGGGSTSYNRSSIDLASIDQLARMPKDECIVLIKACRPYWGKKYDLLSHPNFKKAMEVRGKFEIVMTEKARKIKEANEGPLRKRRHLDDVSEMSSSSSSSSAVTGVDSQMRNVTGQKGNKPVEKVPPISFGPNDNSESIVELPQNPDFKNAKHSHTA